MDATDRNDAAIMRAARRGDGGAFAILVHRHAEAVYKFAYRYVRTSEDAEDIAQEAFIRAWRNLKKFDASRSFKTWLFAIAKNAALDAVKKKKPFLFSQFAPDDGALEALLSPHLAADQDMSDSAEIVAPDVLYDRKELSASIERLLGELPTDYRTVLTMRYHGELKFREIAATLGEPVDTVKSRHRRGLMLLKKLIAEAA